MTEAASPATAEWTQTALTLAPKLAEEYKDTPPHAHATAARALDDATTSTPLAAGPADGERGALATTESCCRQAAGKLDSGDGVGLVAEEQHSRRSRTRRHARRAARALRRRPALLQPAWRIGRRQSAYQAVERSRAGLEEVIGGFARPARVQQQYAEVVEGITIGVDGYGCLEMRRRRYGRPYPAVTAQSRGPHRVGLSRAPPGNEPRPHPAAPSCRCRASSRRHSHREDGAGRLFHKARGPRSLVHFDQAQGHGSRRRVVSARGARLVAIMPIAARLSVPKGVTR